MQKIDLLTVQNQYSSTYCFAKGLSDAFQRLGIRSNCYSLEADTMREHLHQMIVDPPDLTISFSYIGFGFDEKDHFLPDYFPCPHLTYWVDGPFYTLPLFRSPNNYVSVVDEMDFRGLQSTCGNRLLFLPHAVEATAKIPSGNRPYAITMSATFLDYEERIRTLDHRFSAATSKVILQAVDNALMRSDLTITLAIHLALKELEIKRLDATFEEIYFEVEYIYKGKDRLDLLAALKDFPIDLFGSTNTQQGWKKAVKQFPHITLHNPLPFEESLNLFEQSQIVLNSSPQFRHGSHERVFNALARGAMVVTNNNSYLQKSYSEADGILYYDPHQPSRLAESVREHLLNPTKRRDAVERGFNITMQHHSWDVRAQQILNLSKTFSQTD